MQSGDVLIFRGDTDCHVLHGVTGIRPETAPPHLAPLLCQGRIGLQLRGDPEKPLPLKDDARGAA